MGFVEWTTNVIQRKVPLGVYLVTAFILLVLLFLPTLAGRLVPGTPQSMSDGIDLKDFIVKVKSDLEEADRLGVRTGQKPLLKLYDVQLVANFVVQSKAAAEVKLVTVNGSALSGIERSQQITLHLKPVPPVVVDVKPEPMSFGPDPNVVGPSVPPEKKARP